MTSNLLKRLHSFFLLIYTAVCDVHGTNHRTYNKTQTVVNGLIIVTPHSYYLLSPSEERKTLIRSIKRAIHNVHIPSSTLQSKTDAQSQSQKSILNHSDHSSNPPLTQKLIQDQYNIFGHMEGVHPNPLYNIDLNPNFHGGKEYHHIQIINQTVYYQSFYHAQPLYIESMLRYLQRIVKIYYISNVDFLINVSDFDGNYHNNVPKFSIPRFASNINTELPTDRNIIHFVDSYMFMFWNSSFTKIMSGSNDPYYDTWNSKIEKVFWRGANSGGHFIPKKMHRLPRLTLVILSILFPEYIDAKLVGYYFNPGDGDHLKTFLERTSGYVMTDHSKISTHAAYKYVISVDGHGASWLRVPKLMLCSSVLFKQEGYYTEWYYSAMKPFVHYIPVKQDLSDLIDRIEWARSHDKEVQKIAKQGYIFIKNSLTPKDIDMQVVLMLNEYARLHQNENIVPTLPLYRPSQDILDKEASNWFWIHQSTV